MGATKNEIRHIRQAGDHPSSRGVAFVSPSNTRQTRLDDFNREALGIEVDFSVPAERVIRSLNRIIEWRGKPETIWVDTGPEYISGKLQEWADKQGIAIQHIQPRKPQQNADIER